MFKIKKNYYTGFSSLFLNVSHFNNLSRDNIPGLILISIFDVINIYSSLVLEDYLSLLQIQLTKLKNKKAATINK